MPKQASIDVCSQSDKPLLSLATALANMWEAITAVTEVEDIPLRQALGRVLDDTDVAPCALPLARNSAMDGYAFASADVLTGRAFSLRQVGTSWAGRPFTGSVHTGECVRIFTGAVVPEACDSVIMQEHVECQQERIIFPKDTLCFENIRQAGEDIPLGSEIGRRGQVLSALDLALFAAVGKTSVRVRRKVKVIFFSTGDECCEAGSVLHLGQIYESNLTLLQGLLVSPLFDCTHGGVIPDNKQQLTETLLAAAEHHDVVITTGGVSVGEADYCKEVLTDCGQVNFWKVAVKPGKPFAFGTLGESYFFGLPGNPIAVWITFKQLVQPALYYLASMQTITPVRLLATCTTDLKKMPGRMEFQCGLLRQDEAGRLWVATSGKQGSHRFGSAAKSNCLIVLPLENAGVQEGELVWVEPSAAFLGLM
ncbi:MAG: molybdopterin molybdenumtransferase MoeA [Methylococcaceae bacterium]|nr:MAG: molybdopterin molybdenumtransferase MoeA [Methylococcaceae bacterium]